MGDMMPREMDHGDTPARFPRQGDNQMKVFPRVPAHRLVVLTWVLLFAMLVMTESLLADEPEPIGVGRFMALDDIVDVNVAFRYRFEHRDNFDFNDAVDDQDGFHLFRTRLNVDLNEFESIRAFLQLQDARIGDSDFSNKTPFEDDLDIRQLYLDLKNLFGGNLTFRIGRQELSYGDERLIGGFNWSNVAQSFDAVKAIYQRDRLQVDFFASRRVLIDSNSFNEWDRDDDFYGVYATFSRWEQQRLELYYLYRDTETAIAFGPNVGSGKLQESTIGLRFGGNRSAGFDYAAEAAFQFGDFGAQDIEAYALIVEAGYRIPGQWAPRIGFGVEWASGDEDPSDGERNTFDNLFPTNHKFYGYMDRASLQNLLNVHLIGTIKPRDNLSVQLDLHHLQLDETSDSLYNAGRRAVRTASFPGVSDQIGREVDLLVKYGVNKHLKLLGGYSHFFADDFLEATGSGDDGDFIYLQTTLSF